MSEDLSLPEESEEGMKEVIEKAKEVSTDMITVCIGKDYDKLLRIVLEKGISPNTYDTDGSFLVHHCVKYGSYNCLKVLLLYGANVNSTDADKNTALHLSVERLNVKIAKLLIDCGAKNTKNAEGKYPIDLLPSDKKSDGYREMRKLLKNYELLCRVFRHMFEKEYEDDLLSVSQHFGFLLLEKVVCVGNVDEITKLVHEFHVSPNTTNPFGITALHVSVLKECSNEVIERLIKLGCRVNAKTILGFTALHFAAMKNNAKIAKILISNGASKTSVNYTNKTAQNIAEDMGYDDIVKVLQSKKSKKK